VIHEIITPNLVDGKLLLLFDFKYITLLIRANAAFHLLEDGLSKASSFGQHDLT
jgi:hypothetical protein